ncbi:hypothetical protein [Corynebacterium lujinxingii]|uniref:Uncharacterized protein n=1 Tax=Corynebacterium lujinxingii TaxID=2763010 RepID=A0A7H0K0U0_9CORY|nr:hypothetical protein [Corynebacterium lujinxingii]MBC3179346.1 hypothetical protein [Corynebacterium lujinxingii]NNO11456.1 hypothetical protein [Corynebacterium lujinxingii]QNP90906.1 hypothetical protein IAU68_03840 [Corynebacterium lujinxingii]
MTTPVDIVMPYGVTVVGDGTNNPKLATAHPKQLQNLGLKLPPGPCRIAASWEGEEKVAIVVQTNGTRNYRTVLNLPEKTGGGGRQGMVTVGAVENDYVYLNGHQLSSGTKGTLEVYPLNFE